MLSKHIYKVDSVISVQSGDDLVLMLNLGHDGLYRKTRCRLHGVDVPSTYNSDNEEAKKLKNFISKALSNSKDSQVEVVSYLNNSWMVVLYTKDPETKAYVSINQVLIQNGYVFKRENINHA